MKIAIVGSGGVGGYFGGRLVAKGVDVTFLARGAHLAALRSKGLRILSPSGDLHLPAVKATDDPTSVGPVDVVLFAVKLYDTESAIALLPPLIGPHTLVVPLQNGVGSVERLARAIGRGHVAGGTCYVAAVIAEPGVIKHTAMGRLIFGPLRDGADRPPAPLQELLSACKGAGVEAVLSETIETEIWAKFVRLAVMSGMTAVTRSPVGVIVNDPDLAAMVVDALRESFAVANACGVPLDATVIPAIMKANQAIPGEMKSSMLEDLERGRPLELPFLSGMVVKLGEDHGVPTPVHRFIATALKPFVNGAR